MDLTILERILLFISAVIVINIIFRYLKLPLILGYLIVGSLISSHILGWTPGKNMDYVQSLAEFGVVFLMFTIGLEFSLSTLISMRHSVFLLGSLQVLLTMLIFGLVGYFLGISLLSAIVVGSVAAMSSTAIVMKQLSETYETQTLHGINSVGVLLFQDLAVIPILVLITSLTANNHQNIPLTILESFIKGGIAIFLMMVLGRGILNTLFHLVAATRLTELFTLSVLLVVMGSAWLSWLAGMSYTLGAFLAGMMLGETQYRHQIIVEIRPFRDVLLGLFFVSIGFLVNFNTLLENWNWVLLLFVGLLVGKCLLITMLCLLLRYNFETSARIGLILAEGGEFGFAILTLALANRLLDPSVSQVILKALILSFAVAPIIIRNNGKIIQLLLPKLKKIDKKLVELKLNEDVSYNNHIIICGYGRVGQNIARFLEKVEQPYFGLDVDPSLIHSAKQAGEPVAFGDCTHPEILKNAGLYKARAVLVSFDQIEPAIKVVDFIREQNIEIPILVRCRDLNEFEKLRDRGANIVVTEIFEESLTLANYLLQTIQIPHKKIAKLLQEVRDENYALLSNIYPGSNSDIIGEENLDEFIRVIYLPTHEFKIKNLNELNLDKVKLISLYRGNEKIKPKESEELKPGDSLILYGVPKYLDEIEKKLLN